MLLRYDCDVNVKNAEGLTAGQIAKNQDIRDLIEGVRLLITLYIPNLKIR